MTSVLARLETASASTWMLMFMFVVVFCALISWHRNPNIPFDLSQMLVDSTTGKIAVEKVGYVVALGISTWGVVALIESNHITEWYFGVYISAFVLGRMGSTGISAYKDVKAEKPS